jgi:hypothetical protein
MIGPTNCAEEHHHDWSYRGGEDGDC